MTATLPNAIVQTICPVITTTIEVADDDTSDVIWRVLIDGERWDCGRTGSVSQARTAVSRALAKWASGLVD